MNKSTWIIFIVAVVAILGGLIWYSQASNPSANVANVNAAKVQGASSQNGNIADHMFGSDAQKVTVIEYGDFECPYCGEAFPQMRSVMQTYQSNVTFIFRNFPLSSIHPNARAAAAVAEAAGLQGKYWQMHDLLYTDQNQWVNLTGQERTDMFTSFAKSLNLDMTKFNKDLTSNNINQKIAFDMALGNKMNVTATPSIYVDGTLISNSINQDLETGSGSKLAALLNTKLKASGLPIPSSQGQ